MSKPAGGGRQGMEELLPSESELGLEFIERLGRPMSCARLRVRRPRPNPVYKVTDRGMRTTRRPLLRRRAVCLLSHSRPKIRHEHMVAGFPETSRAEMRRTLCNYATHGPPRAVIRESVSLTPCQSRAFASVFAPCERLVSPGSIDLRLWERAPSRRDYLTSSAGRAHHSGLPR